MQYWPRTPPWIVLTALRSAVFYIDDTNRPATHTNPPQPSDCHRAGGTARLGGRRVTTCHFKQAPIQSGPLFAHTLDSRSLKNLVIPRALSMHRSCSGLVKCT